MPVRSIRLMLNVKTVGSRSAKTPAAATAARRALDGRRGPASAPTVGVSALSPLRRVGMAVVLVMARSLVGVVCCDPDDAAPGVPDASPLCPDLVPSAGAPLTLFAPARTL